MTRYLYMQSADMWLLIHWKALGVSAVVYAAKLIIDHDMRCGLLSKFFDHLFLLSLRVSVISKF